MCLYSNEELGWKIHYINLLEKLDYLPLYGLKNSLNI